MLSRSPLVYSKILAQRKRTWNHQWRTLFFQICLELYSPFLSFGSLAPLRNRGRESKFKVPMPEWFYAAPVWWAFRFICDAENRWRSRRVSYTQYPREIWQKFWNIISNTLLNTSACIHWAKHSSECHITSPMRNQHKWWLGAVRKRAITWAIVDPWYRYMPPGGATGPQGVNNVNRWMKCQPWENRQLKKIKCDQSKWTLLFADGRTYYILCKIAIW